MSRSSGWIASGPRVVADRVPGLFDAFDPATESLYQVLAPGSPVLELGPRQRRGESAARTHSRDLSR